MMKSDSAERIPAAMTRLPDPRVSHFWDSEGKLANEYSVVLRFRDDLPKWDVYSIFRRLLTLYNRLFCNPSVLPAWDVYLVFSRRVHWKDQPPAPNFWMHQLPLAKVKRLNSLKFAVE